MFATSVLFYQISAICQVRIFQATTSQSEKSSLASCAILLYNVYTFNRISPKLDLAPTAQGSSLFCWGFLLSYDRLSSH